VSGEIAVPDFVTECVVSVKMASHFPREIHRFIMSMISNYQKKTRYFDMFLACACPNIRILNDNPLYHLHMQQWLSHDFFSCSSVGATVFEGLSIMFPFSHAPCGPGN